MNEFNTDRTVEKLLRQQAALAAFGSFAFHETNLHNILTEAARICAASLEVPFCKICRYRPEQDDLLIEAGSGWRPGVIGRVISQANESSPQGRAYVTGEPVIIRNLQTANALKLPPFYDEHGIVSTVDVIIPAIDGVAYGVLEVDSPDEHQYDEHDINFLTGFANVLAEAVATATRVEAIQELLRSKSLLAEELQHRVRNNLQMITGMLGNYARTTTEGAARDGIDLIVRRVTTLAQVYDSLLGVGLSEMIDIADYLAALCKRLPELQAERIGTVAVTFEGESFLLDLDQVTTLGMVVAELVANSLGHAFPVRAGTIAIVLTRLSPTRAQLEIRDDGIGFHVEAASDRHGVGLAKRLMERIDGTLDVHSGKGTTWTLSFAVASDGAKKAA
jgi:two-component sensor histidine kinase